MNAVLHAIIDLLVNKIVLVVTYVTFNHLKLSHFPKGIMFLSTAFMKDLTMISCL